MNDKPETMLHIPPGYVEKTARVPAHKIVMACKDRMAIGDVERYYRDLQGERTYRESNTLSPPPKGYWDPAGNFRLLDGRHRYLAHLMHGDRDIVVRWNVPETGDRSPPGTVVKKASCTRKEWMEFKQKANRIYGDRPFPPTGHALHDSLPSIEPPAEKYKRLYEEEARVNAMYERRMKTLAMIRTTEYPMATVIRNRIVEALADGRHLRKRSR